MLEMLRRVPVYLRASIAALLVATIAVPALAQSVTTGAISGVVTDAQSGAPLAGVTVDAVSGSGNRRTVTDAKGFYTLQALLPDTYTVSFQHEGYAPDSVPGVTVQQVLTVHLDARLAKEGMKTIAHITSRGPSNLVKPTVTADEYTVSGDQLNAISGGNSLGKTLYQYIQAVPGVTSSAFSAQPRIHGGSVTDEQYEFDGIPIKDRITGFFTTNLSNVGIGNVEVFTGGLGAQDAGAGLGVINTVVKTGTYPSFGSITVGSAIGGAKLVDLTAEYGGATKNHRWSWYTALATTNSNNVYASGETYPAVLIEGYNGPGPVKTTDIIGNFHYRPNNKDDFQFLIQNGLGDFNFDYLMQRGPGQAPPLTAVPCPGYSLDNNSKTGASGGVAPNGQACPAGLYFSTANTQNGGGNIWHHYSGIGKLQWNHLINDHSFFSLRFAENFNQYIFDQPIVEANLPLENSSDFKPNPGCPNLPYQPGTPVPVAGGTPCMQQWNWFSTGYTGDRRSEMYLGSLDYTNDVSDNFTLKAGVTEENDQNLANSYFSLYFNSDGSWPGINFLSTYPDHIVSGYVDPQFKVKKFLLSPGLLYQRMTYDVPGQPYSVGIWNPTFAATYQMGRNDVLRGSYTNSTSFVGTEFVYRQGSGTYSPATSTFSADPTIIHSGDLMWEHQIDAHTSFKIGPYFNRASNIFGLYRPILSVDPNTGIIKYGSPLASNGGYRQSTGAELGINHDDNRPVGTSWYLAATYDNFWTNITSSLTGSYGGYGLPSALGRIRSTGDPLFSGTLTADFHENGLHLIPQLYYQTSSPYNVGLCVSKKGSYTSCTSSAAVQPQQLYPQSWSSGYFILNATVLKKFGPDDRFTIGIQGTNLTNNTNDTTPCNVGKLGHTPQLGPGCSPYYPVGLQSGVPSSGYTYQNYSQNPRQFEVFLSTKLP